MNDYKTLEEFSFDEFVVKKSRFIGYAAPVQTAQQALDFIAKIKAKHWDATHNVYAYCLRDGQIKRYSDDGEPQGTAGMPVLDVILKQGVTDCVVVATRYFGGIMLGAGGLVRAYSQTARIALDSARVITMSVCTIARVQCDYNFYGKLQPLIFRQGGTVENTDFGSSVTVTLKIASELYDALNAAVIDQSCGKFNCEKLEEKYARVN